jgi:hypothetical protein
MSSLEAHLRAIVREETMAAIAEIRALIESIRPAKAGKAKADAAPESAPPAAAQPPVATAPAPQPAPSPVAPTLSKEKLNKAVLAVAAVNRDAAVQILAKFGAANTATLPAEKYQAVFDAMEEEKARLDAAAVQVANSGSLV